jgi:alpha-beta hydrolase superfamily lysophospholipase
VNFRKLRGRIDRFSLSNSLNPNSLAKEYFGFYGIDFENQLGLKHHFGSFKAGQFELALHVFEVEDPKGTVFLLHGYYDHVGIYQHPIRYFLQRGYTVVAYDHPGHGLSTGERASINSFSQYQNVFSACIELLGGNTPAPHYLVAQSMGGAIAMTHLLSHQDTLFRKTVLFAPLVHPAGWKLGKWMHAIGRYVIQQQQRIFVANSHDEEFLRFLREDDALQPDTLPMQWVTALKEWISRFHKLAPVGDDCEVLIIQGTDDNTVDWHYNLGVIAQKFPDCRVHYVPDGRHQLVNESKSLRREMFREIDNFI